MLTRQALHWLSHHPSCMFGFSQCPIWRGFFFFFLSLHLQALLTIDLVSCKLLMQKPLTSPFPPTDLNVTCRYAGVFHVEKNGRYSISRTEAADLCQAFNSTLPTMDQMKLALSKGFETCR